jgi:hypothetical protein
MLFEDAGFVDSIWAMGGIPLTGRLRLIRAAPYILKIPGASALWASSWEIAATKRC